MNNTKEICAALELCVHELDGAISGENAQDAEYLVGCIMVQLGRLRECIASIKQQRAVHHVLKIGGCDALGVA